MLEEYDFLGLISFGCLSDSRVWFGRNFPDTHTEAATQTRHIVHQVLMLENIVISILMRYMSTLSKISF